MIGILDMLAEIQLLQKRVIGLIRELQSARAEINRLNHLPPPEELTTLQENHSRLIEEHGKNLVLTQALQQQINELEAQQKQWDDFLTQLKVEKEQLLAQTVSLTLERDQLLQKNHYAREKVSSIIQRLQVLSQGHPPDHEISESLDETGENI